MALIQPLLIGVYPTHILCMSCACPNATKLAHSVGLLTLKMRWLRFYYSSLCFEAIVEAEVRLAQRAPLKQHPCKISWFWLNAFPATWLLQDYFIRKSSDKLGTSVNCCKIEFVKCHWCLKIGLQLSNWYYLALRMSKGNCLPAFDRCCCLITLSHFWLGLILMP